MQLLTGYDIVPVARKQKTIQPPYPRKVKSKIQTTRKQLSDKCEEFVIDGDDRLEQ